MRWVQISEREQGDVAEDQRPNNDAADALLRCKQLLIHCANKQLMVAGGRAKEAFLKSS